MYGRELIACCRIHVCARLKEPFAEPWDRKQSCNVQGAEILIHIDISRMHFATLTGETKQPVLEVRFFSLAEKIFQKLPD